MLERKMNRIAYTSVESDPCFCYKLYHPCLGRNINAAKMSSAAAPSQIHHRYI